MSIDRNPNDVPPGRVGGVKPAKPLLVHWRGLAACASLQDPDWMFPETAAGELRAKQVCGSCRVRAECLDWALDRRERFGILGGLNPAERQTRWPRGRLRRVCVGCGKPIDIELRYDEHGRLVAGAAGANRQYHEACWVAAERARARRGMRAARTRRA